MNVKEIVPFAHAGNVLIQRGPSTATVRVDTETRTESVWISMNVKRA